MLSLMSINGELESLYRAASADDPRSTVYKPPAIGQPLVVRYLRFAIRWPEGKPAGEDLMISTFLKVKEEKPASAEAINYFNPEAGFQDGFFELSDFGAQLYGHELIYYTGSYLGEPIKLTTKVMELDRLNKRVTKAVKDGIRTVAGLPMFSSFLPYAALATAGASIFEKVVNIFNRDDVIVSGHDLDLHFKGSHQRWLQSGRVVCIPSRDNDDEDTIIQGYRLNVQNQLIAKDGGDEYAQGSYFVIQINNERHDRYKEFDHWKNAAELLALTNRGGDPAEIAAGLAELARGYNDVKSIREIEDLALDLDNKENRERVKALNKSLSPDIRKIYEDRIKALLGQAES